MNPTFISDYPVEISPARARAPRAQPGLVERFEVFAGGMELANAFSELNDPDEQPERFATQQRRAGAGEERDPALRRGFIQALDHGMPPTGGSGSASIGW